MSKHKSFGYLESEETIERLVEIFGPQSAPAIALQNAQARRAAGGDPVFLRTDNYLWVLDHSDLRPLDGTEHESEDILVRTKS